MTQVEQLLAWFAPWRGVAVAFSGGVDSAVVAAAAHRALGHRAVAITADSPSVPRREINGAREFAVAVGLRHIVVGTDEFSNPAYTRNSGDRCYHCKSTLYDRISELLPSLDVDLICSGANLDDLGDYRPGLTAAAERGIRHPLQECGFTKADVRSLARTWGLAVAEKPASPCLASRLAPGVAVTPERTRRVELAEEFLRSLGFTDCRVRYHDGDLARVEVPAAELDFALSVDCRDAIREKLRELGFRFATIDLDGFRSGSLNALLTLEMRGRFQSKNLC